jgi:O-antigen/teichoic acid export membrane protein
MLAILRRPSSMLTVANILAMALGVLSAAIQARILGPEGRGELATAVVPGTVLSMLLCLGLPDYFARRAARDGNGSHAAKLALVLSSAIGCLAIWPYIILVQFLVPPETHAWWLLALYACSTPLFILGYCLVAISMGLSNWYFVAVSKILPQVLTVVGLIAMSLFSANALTVGTLLIGSNLLGLLLPLLGKTIRPKGQLDLLDIKEAVSFGLRGWTTGALGLLNQRVDLLLLTAMAAKTDLGYYAVATTVASVLNAIPTAVGIPARNKVATGDTEGIARTVALVQLLTLAGAVILCLNLGWVVPLVLGPAFNSAVPIMFLLAGAQVPLAGVIVLTFGLVGSGRPGAPFIGEAIALITTTAAIVLLFPIYGVFAAASANFFWNCLSLIALLVLARKHLSRVPFWHFFILTPTGAKSLFSNR